MTNRERKYLFLINYLTLFQHRLIKAAELDQQRVIDECERRVDSIVADTHQWIQAKEEQISQLIKERDEAWAANLDLIWTEKEELAKKIEKQRLLRKERSRYERQV